jgi:hypothetical protein
LLCDDDELEDVEDPEYGVEAAPRAAGSTIPCPPFVVRALE